jgi:hypothetical protein
MATVLQIKRTNTANLPSTLDQGELVYLYDTSSTDGAAGGNGGRLMIGDPTTSTNTPIKIGGSYYTSLMDHTTGIATASAAALLDSNKKIDEWNVDNIKLDGNTISSTDTNGNITLSPNGTGKTVIGNAFIGDANTSLQEYIEDITGGSITNGTAITIAYDDTAGTSTVSVTAGGIVTALIADDAVTAAKIAAGAVETANIADGNVTTAKLADDAVTTDKVLDANITDAKLASNAVTTAKITDGNVTTAKIADDAVTTAKIAAANVTETELATDAVTTTKIADANVTTAKIAALNVTTTKIANSAVTSAKIADSAITAAKIADGVINNDKITDASIANAKLVNDGITIGDTDTSLGGTITDVTGLTSVAVDNITVDGNAVSTTDTDGDLALAPNGEGTVTVPSGYEGRTGFTGDSLVNKTYVDNVASGLDVKESVVAATTANLVATYDNAAGTLTGNANGALALDGYSSLATGDRVLVKDQTDATENGIYKVTAVGVDGVSAFTLTRTPDADEPEELTGGTFFFVERGTNYVDTGWVATHNGTPTFGTTEITFDQFSGAGSINPGAAISKTGSTLDVNVDGTTVEVNGSDELRVKDGGITNAKVGASAAIAQSKLNMNSASTRANATGIAQADLGLASFDSAQFTVTNGFATVKRLDAGAYS